MYCYTLDSCVGNSVIFFVQAEDGIRDLVRSRGLGDVYKRQGSLSGTGVCGDHEGMEGVCVQGAATSRCQYAAVPVSYTHLTLPTSDLV